MWQSELTAMAADRELRETWGAVMALWAKSAASMLQTMPRHDQSRRGSGPAEQAGSTPAYAASDAGLAEVQQLNRRILELEHRLAELERDQPGRGRAGAA